MQSVMKHQFSRVPQAEIQRSQFDRSHGLKTTFDASYLIPIFCDEALPGDTFNLNMTGFARLATPIKPLMDNLYMETFFFAVPNRLLWENWEKFNGSQDTPGDSTEYTVPKIDQLVPIEENTLSDYMGLPIGVDGFKFNALHHRAYNLIWNEWFRDQNLQDPVDEITTDSDQSPLVYELLKRGKRHDYFTSCLPWPQKGEAVAVPLAGTAPVVPLSAAATPSFQNPAETQPMLLRTRQGTDLVGNGVVAVGDNVMQWDDPQLVAQISAGALDVNAIREGFQLQKMLEKDARGGTRYTEVIRAHFGVTSPDSRLQRPEYLGGGSSPVTINPVAQTNNTDPQGTTPQGNLAAIGTANLNRHGFTKSFTEHCTIIGLINVRADLTYQQGINRMWSRDTRYDYYWPSLAQIGEQAVLNKEIWVQGNSIDEEVFGYQERFAEYRYKPSLITGEFRSQAPQSLDVWHLSQEFEDLPTLSSEFIEENVPLDRAIAVTSEPHFLFDAYFDYKCARPMPLYSVPGNMDRF